jgi:hypothetical protein
MASTSARQLAIAALLRGRDPRAAVSAHAPRAPALHDPALVTPLSPVSEQVRRLREGQMALLRRRFLGSGGGSGSGSGSGSDGDSDSGDDADDARVRGAARAAAKLEFGSGAAG